MSTTEYIFYCKRAILFLSSSIILTPIPLSARRVCPPPATKAGGTHSPGGEADGGSIFWKTREIGLPSYIKICTLWCPHSTVRTFWGIPRGLGMDGSGQKPEAKFLVLLWEFKLAAWGKVNSGMKLPMFHKMYILRLEVNSHPFTPTYSYSLFSYW